MSASKAKAGSGGAGVGAAPPLAELAALGFSRVEAEAWIALLERGELTGYQVAKALGAARSSVYPALDSLVRRGAVDPIPGEPSLYAARDPEAVIGKLKRELNGSADAAMGALSRLSPRAAEHRVLNIEGLERILSRSGELVARSARELLVDSDLDLAPLAPGLGAAIERGVRFIVYSCSAIDVAGLPVQTVFRGMPGSACAARRLILVADMEEALVSGETPDPRVGFFGTWTRNPLSVRMAAERIHLDAYLTRLSALHGRDLVDERVKLGSLLEGG